MKPFIIALTETWLKDESNLSQFSLKGYHKLTTCNRSNGERGSVCLFLDDSFKFKVLLKDTLSETLLVETFTPLKTYIMVTYWRELKRSKNAYCERLTEELNYKRNGKTNVIVCGDLVANKHSSALRDIMLSHNLKPSRPSESHQAWRKFRVMSGSYPFRHENIRKGSFSKFYYRDFHHYMVFTKFAQKFSSVEQSYRVYSDLNNLTKKPILSAFLGHIQSRLSRVDWNLKIWKMRYSSFWMQIRKRAKYIFHWNLS